MGIKRAAAFGTLAVLAALYGCQTQPDIEGQRDIGFKRAERSDEVMAETQGGRPAAQDTTTAASVRQRAAADQLASGEEGGSTVQ